ncbi:hypothetical protein [Synechococcus elongatus]|uniref:Uncharacterized protein n=1 Tax=Synechococcus elongatus PCC 11801 TaxID=2219813 RepID=A0AAQ3RCR8_SYNEL|nr:hypothetical protein [Synechococcus elongatus]
MGFFNGYLQQSRSRIQVCLDGSSILSLLFVKTTAELKTGDNNPVV